LKNVNEKNSSYDHFLNNVKKDSFFIDSIFPEIEDIFKKSGVNKKIDFVDIGCGTGLVANKLKCLFPYGNIEACDFSDVKIKSCREYHKRDIFFVHNIYEPFDKKYDFIVCTEVLEHLVNPARAVENMFKALKPHGRLLITVPDGRKDTFAGHIHFWSEESFKLFMEPLIKKPFKGCYKSIQGKNCVIAGPEYLKRLKNSIVVIRKKSAIKLN
jgi:2-polyprenyl-3-methyl-5-hydroxy-6-metoxy-1,4-benzoquinol methylase